MKWFRRSPAAPQIVLDVGPRLRSDVERLLAFVREHEGPGHEIGVYRRGDQQTLFCSCGLPETPHVALREEDLFDG